MDIDKQVSFIAEKERELRTELDKLVSSNPTIFKQKEILEAQLDELQKMKDDVKDELIKRKDFDLHKVDGVKVSVSRIIKVAVDDIDKVSDDFKETKVVANEKKAQEYIKVMGEIPAGFVDKSYHRLTWKDTNESA